MSARARRPEVLHVEDDAVIAQMYRLGLERAGCQVTVAADATAALKLTANRGFDLVLLDIQLPVVDGLELLKAMRLQERSRQLPVAILSNRDPDDPALATAQEFGILGWLLKSQTTPTTLVDHVHGWFGASGPAAPMTGHVCP